MNRYQIDFLKPKGRLSREKPRCSICNGYAVEQYGYYYSSQLKICGSCAEKVANIYCHAHSGKWFSWKNEPSTPPKKQKISNTLRTQVFERDAYRCLHCGTHKELCADHIHPESLGGETTFNNLQTLCRSCNSKKGARV